MKSYAILLSVLVLCTIFTTNISAAMRIRSYQRKNGAYVMPYYRTRTDHLLWNNYNTKGNRNPYTGRTGYKNPYRSFYYKPYRYESFNSSHP